MGGSRNGGISGLGNLSRLKKSSSSKKEKTKSFDEDKAVKVRGLIRGFNAGNETKLKKAMMNVGFWIVSESGSMSGQVRATVVNSDDKKITYDLASMDEGVKKTGKFGATSDTVEFRLMCICRKVSKRSLQKELLKVLEESGLEYKVKSKSSVDDDWDDDDDDDEDDW